MLARFHRQSMYIVMVMYMMVYLCSPMGTVLCLGTDGHLGIKRLASGQCVPTSLTALHPKPGLCIEDTRLAREECGPCTDIPLSIHGDVQPPRRLNEACPTRPGIETVPCAFAATVPDEIALFSASLYRSLASIDDFHLAPLHGIVLLI